MEIANRTGRIKAKTREQFILMSIRVAALRGQSPFVFLSFGKSSKIGLYKVVASGSPPSARYKRGGKSYSRKFTWGRAKGEPGKEKLKLIHSFARKSITIPETRFLRKNVEKTAGTKAVIFKKEADRIFDRFFK